MCIYMTSHTGSNDDTLVLLEHWIRELPQIPVSILSGPTTFDYGNLVQMRDLGADIFTVLVEAVTPGIFDRTRCR